MTDPYPFRPDHVDAGVTAMHAERRALISQIPGITQRTRSPRYCQCGHTPTMHALHTDDHPCRNCDCDMYRGTAA